MRHHPVTVRIGDQVYVREGGEEVGSVRVVERDHLVVYVENASDFVVAAGSVLAVHDGKVVLDEPSLDATMREAIRKAHQREDGGT